ncbi:DUF697 domain-containing protein [Nitrospira sp. BLG_2]|uniref:DUF697 domain-containing protein n=1 Tax=Nitrospira sp. BLG_2 TaxID=3397507 RepID=UPI003B9B77B0
MFDPANQALRAGPRWKPPFWALVGLGTLLFLGLVVLANVLDIGERLSRLHPALEFAFYMLVLCAIYGLLIRPVLSVISMTTHPLQRVLLTDSSVTKKEYKAVAKRFLQGGGLSAEVTTRLTESLWSGVGLEQEVKAALDEKRARSSQIVKDHARLAFLSTAVIQNGSLDALMLAYANLKLVRALVIHFGFRPSFPALLTMYGQILAAALIAERVEDMQLEDVFPPLSASVGGGVMSAIPGMHLLIHALLQGMGSAFLTLRTGYLTEEYILRGAQAFDRRRERKSANRRAAKDLLGVVLATAAQLPASMRTLLKAANLFREPVHQS